MADPFGVRVETVVLFRRIIAARQRLYRRDSARLHVRGDLLRDLREHLNSPSFCYVGSSNAAYLLGQLTLYVRLLRLR